MDNEASLVTPLLENIGDDDHVGRVISAFTSRSYNRIWVTWNDMRVYIGSTLPRLGVLSVLILTPAVEVPSRS